MPELNMSAEHIAAFDQAYAQTNDAIRELINKLRELAEAGVSRELAVGGLANHLLRETPAETTASIAAVAVARLDALGQA